jgi:hypothetical protein
VQVVAELRVHVGFEGLGRWVEKECVCVCVFVCVCAYEEVEGRGVWWST